jgi:hypothetical protein
MYEMYPDAWPVSPDRSSTSRPRRRARKEHSVVPAILTAQTPRMANRRH